jgi:hypothetical protein
VALKLTLTDGRTVAFPFGPDSQLTVSTPDGVNGLKHGSWGEISHVEIVDDSELSSDDDQPADVVEPPPVVEPAPVVDEATLASPYTAIDHAATLPLADAKAHVDAALVRFPDDPDLLAAKAELDAESES